MRSSATIHLYAAARAELARARMVAARGPKPGESLLADMPRWERLDLDPYAPRDGHIDRGSGLEMRREFSEAEREFVLSAGRLSKVPFFALFAEPASADAEELDSRIADCGLVNCDSRTQSPAPPETAGPGGRYLPTYCLTPRLLAQRPITTRATRVALPLGTEIIQH